MAMQKKRLKESPRELQNADDRVELVIELRVAYRDFYAEVCLFCSFCASIEY